MTKVPRHAAPPFPQHPLAAQCAPCTHPSARAWMRPSPPQAGRAAPNPTAARHLLRGHRLQPRLPRDFPAASRAHLRQPTGSPGSLCGELEARRTLRRTRCSAASTLPTAERALPAIKLSSVGTCCVYSQLKAEHTALVRQLLASRYLKACVDPERKPAPGRDPRQPRSALLKPNDSHYRGQ